MNENGNYTNHLRHETSPYLLQHANNPVDWYPWGPEALEKARRENKPILLSIGYSACHWCHVMAHESFEDTDTAQVMNELFVNIKVDREERPDLDKIYQTAHSLLAQRSGGWPLTMFLTPKEQIPFFGGTYFPKEPKHGLPAFTDMCKRILEFYQQNKDDIKKQNQTLMNFMGSMNKPESENSDGLSAMPLDVARQQLEKQYDDTHGGFGSAPKFPHPTSLERLLRHWASTRDGGQPDHQALNMVQHSMNRMALGGVFDQIDGGFCRYSVDDLWMIPHFEKMLYDSGPLLSLYSELWAATDEALYQRVVENTADWILREMQSPEGGYYSSLDADSEGTEGKFYVWDQQELKSILSAQEYRAAAQRFGFDREANFEGQWHAHIYPDSSSDEDPDLQPAIGKLFAKREKRIRPGRDEKILVSWNALMIKGMALASRTFENESYQLSAEQALQFIQTHMWQDQRLFATYKDGRAHHNAYLDDYVFLIDAILELLQVRWKTKDLEFAIQLADIVLEHFPDPTGGFFFTADDHETLIQRPKTLSDDAMPSGNAIAAKVFGRLGHLLGENRYLEAAENTLKAAWGPIQQNPYGHTGLCLALEETLYPVEIIIVRVDEDFQTWQREANKHYAPRRLCFFIPNEQKDLPRALAEKIPQDNSIAYICKGTECLPPVTTLEDFRKQLSPGP